MADSTAIFLGKGDPNPYLDLKYANRHGLVAGATGTGKTVTLQTLAEGFSAHGVPVFCADVKGDLSGLSQAGTQAPRLVQRAKEIGLPKYVNRAFPVVFWDLFGVDGHPIRTTLSEMGPVLLARLLELPEAQEGVLNIAFKIADDNGMLLLDLKDLRALLNFLGENSEQVSIDYGNVTKPSIGAIQRRLLVLEQQGAEKFFGEPALELEDLMMVSPEGFGAINVLAAHKLIQSPKLYSTFLLWLLAELFEDLPEVGDLDKPRLVFFFDEAHLLFDETPKALVDQVEQVVRLIRSKGVGVYFVTQSPLDVPEKVLGQLGNRVQHALRAFTPRDQKSVRTAAETFRANPKLDVAKAITELAVGEALVSTLEAGGTPGIVRRTLIAPPASRLGIVTPEERRAVVASSPIRTRYDTPVDRESAYEQLAGRHGAEEAPRGGPIDDAPAPSGNPWGDRAPARDPYAGQPQAGGYDRPMGRA
ncbi:MAG: DUF853 family protein, partial [Alphaproteobacteria bacterium]|nr:DUF853 family protein [Alphaproteobacteria bacterium]